MNFALVFERCRDEKSARAFIQENNGEELMRLRDVQDKGAISHLCERGPDDVDLLHFLIGMGASLELDSDGSRWSPLHFAATTNKPNITLALLELGIPANILTWSGSTPLDACAISPPPNLKCVDALIAAGGKNLVYKLRGYMKRFVANREVARAASIIVLGLHLVAPTTTLQGNKKDVLRIVARCVWGMRGVL